MKLYIAAHSQGEAIAVAKLLTEAGHTMTASWLDDDMSKSDTLSDAVKTAIAGRDEREVEGSDAVVLLASPRHVPGGKFVEAGIALGMVKPVYLIGHRENMLMWHPLVRRYDSVEDFVRLVCDKCGEHDPHCGCYP